MRAAELLGDRAAGHELAGGDRTHLRTVIGDREQQRQLLLAAGQVVHPVPVAAGDRLARRGGGPLSSASPSRPSASSAAVNATSTWVLVASALVRVASHLRETTSRMAIEARLARLQCVKSQAHTIGFPFQPVRPRRARDRLARRVAGQRQTFGRQHPGNGRFADVHEAGPGAAVTQLAVRAVRCRPTSRTAR
jgi:hypothetical protein